MLAGVAYIVFYASFIPAIGVSRPIHLQFALGANPYGLASLDRTLTSLQAYDISLTLRLPRSPSNLAAGNFMLDLTLLSPASKLEVTTLTPISPPGAPSTALIPPADALYHTRRHAIMTYEPALVGITKQIVALPWYLLGFKREDETLVVPMGESVRFARGWRNVPDSVFLEMRRPDGGVVQVYDVHVLLTARFSGLRWWMYNHRIVSFVLGSAAFWAMEVLGLVLGWGLLVLYPSTRQGGGKQKGKDGEVHEAAVAAVKEEEDDLSDTERSFPTYGRQMPLRYVAKVKMEEAEEDTPLPPLEQEADDESEELVDVGSYRGVEDSGVGTSLSEGGGISRRRSRKEEK